MMQTTQKAKCNLPGLTDVVVEYNMMASMSDYDEFMGTSARQRFDAVVVGVEGWPEKEYPAGPLDRGAPMAWRLWLTRVGPKEAAYAFVADPN